MDKELTHENLDALVTSFSEATKNAFLCLSIFAPEPATCDDAALTAVWAVSADMANDLIEEFEKSGILTPVETEIGKLYSISGVIRPYVEEKFPDW